jgi:hypothetical protein
VIRVPALLFVTAALAGCGEGPDEEDVSDPVQTYVEAIYEGDFNAACGELTDDAQRDAVEFVSGELPALDVESCTTALETFQASGSLDIAATGVMDRKRALEGPESNIEVEEIEVEGGRATVRVAGSRKAVPLREIEGEWRIARLEFAGAPR